MLNNPNYITHFFLSLVLPVFLIVTLISFGLSFNAGHFLVSVVYALWLVLSLLNLVAWLLAEPTSQRAD
jgi:hypothetical protein